MKKTLTLLALLGAVATTPLSAKEVWWKGVTHDPTTHKMEGAITTYKHLYPGDDDSGMCWVAAACNVIAWWQDRVEQNGALIIPKEAPRDYEVFETERHLWPNDGGFSGKAIQMWLTGVEPLHVSKFDATTLGLQFQGYYPRLAGASLDSSNYKSKFGANPDTMRQRPIYKQYEYTMIQTYWFLPSNYDIDDPTKTRYQWASEKIVEFMENDWGVCWGTSTHAMTVYGVELDENGLITKFFNSDNNYSYTGYGYYSELDISMGDEGSMLTSYRGSAPTLANICAIRTTGIRFLDYDVKVGNNLVEKDQDVFSHYCNLIVDGAEDYKLQYDLRDAKAPDSPVEALRVELATEDDWLSSYEVYTDEEVPTGHMRFKGGKVTLVEGVGKYDGGGSVEGTIFFEESAVQDTGRTLVVDRTDTIAKEINLGATSGSNTLEVTEGKTASFGSLSGTGDLDKTGLGAAEVTGDVTLRGDIRVHEGSFIFGKDATISETTSLTVDAGAHVQGKDDKPLTLTIASGVHENNGVMSLATTMTGGVLKGSGTFASVTMDGGTLIVGNSPGRQEYLGDLTVNLGDVVFSVNGWETPATADNCGWASNTYSNIVMDGGSLTLGNGSTLEFALGGGAESTLLANPSTEFELTIATGFSNGNQFTSALLLQLAQQTIFTYSTEDGAFIDARPELKDGETLNSHITNLEYKLADDSTLCVSGVYWRDVPAVPEPTTSTLSLLALAALAARRRK